MADATVLGVSARPPAIRAAAVAVATFAGGTALGLMENPPELFIAVLYVIALVAVLVALTTFERVRRWIPVEWTGFGTPLARRGLDASYIADRRIRLADLVSARQHTIEGRVFERCSFEGPALIGLLGTTVLDKPGFDAGGLPLEALVCEVRRDYAVVGPIGLKDCVLRNCTFVGVGIIGPPGLLDKIKESADA